MKCPFDQVDSKLHHTPRACLRFNHSMLVLFAIFYSNPSFFFCSCSYILKSIRCIMKLSIHFLNKIIVLYFCSSSKHSTDIYLIQLCLIQNFRVVFVSFMPTIWCNGVVINWVENDWCNPTKDTSLAILHSFTPRCMRIGGFAYAPRD